MAIDPTPRPVLTSATLAAFTHDPDNARRHTPRSTGVIVEAIQAAGFGRSIVIDEDNGVLAGNGTLDAAMEAGLRDAIIVDAPPDTLVAVQRRGLSAKQKRHLAIADNRANELSSFDGPVLRDQLTSLVDGEDADTALRRLGFTVQDFAALGPNPGDAAVQRHVVVRCPRCGAVHKGEDV